MPPSFIFLLLCVFLYCCIYFYFDMYTLVYLFIYFWLCWVFIAALRLSLVEKSGATFYLWCTSFLFNAIRTRALGTRALVAAAQGFYQFGSWAPGGAGFSSCGSQVLEHGLSSYGTSPCSRHVESSQTRDRTVSSALAGRFCV